MTGTLLAAPLPKCLSNWIDTIIQTTISRLRDFTRSYDETSYQILKRGPGITLQYMYHRGFSQWLTYEHTAREPSISICKQSLAKVVWPSKCFPRQQCRLSFNIGPTLRRQSRRWPNVGPTYITVWVACRRVTAHTEERTQWRRQTSDVTTSKSRVCIHLGKNVERSSTRTGAPGPVSLTGFPSQFKFDGNFGEHSHLNSSTVIATKFCTWHNSSDMCPRPFGFHSQRPVV